MALGIGPNAPASVSSLEFPDAITAIDAAAAAANAAGGVNGHPIDIDFCGDQGDPNLTTACARTAGTNKDVAVITAVELNTDNALPTNRRFRLAI